MNQIKFVKFKFRKFIESNFGLNKHLILQLLGLIGICSISHKLDKSWINLNNFDFNKIVNFIEKFFLIHSKLRTKIYSFIRKLKVLKSYKGFRHLYSLPVNGQRTKTNARTRKKLKKIKVLNFEFKDKKSKKNTKKTKKNNNVIKAKNKKK